MDEPLSFCLPKDPKIQCFLQQELAFGHERNAAVTCECTTSRYLDVTKRSVFF